MRALDSIEKLEGMIHESFNLPQILFKHSSRCGLSSMALSRMQAYKQRDQVYLVDVIGYRAVSNQIADTFGVMHQSPQLLIIQSGQCVYHTSHMEITASAVENQLSLLGN